MKLKQVYAPYWDWEDFKNGMYEIPPKKDEYMFICYAVNLLSDSDRFYSTGIEILENWPISTAVNLTNTNVNRKSWIGQAACNYRHKVPEIFTRRAWGSIVMEKQFEANRTAERIIKVFEARYEKKDRKIYYGLGNESV